MKLGVLTVPLSATPIEEVIPYLHSLGVQAVELGTGGVTNKSHCDPDIYLNNTAKIDALQKLLADNNMEISALSCHGNPVHPNAEIAAASHKAYVDTLELAQRLGVKTVVTFSGCPGDGAGAQHPNWVTCPWPQEFTDVLNYQWNEVLIPYWKQAAKLAKAAGVQVALEMHPGFCVYNPETMLRLTEATDEVIGANFDPSHLFWQGVDAVEAIKKLGPAIHYVHAKDCIIDVQNTRMDGVLDTRHYSDLLHRAWSFRTVGYGHDESVWRAIFSTLRMVGYDGTVSIEHEDALMSVREGLEKAVAFLKPLVINEKPAEMWWA